MRSRYRPGGSRDSLREWQVARPRKIDLRSQLQSNHSQGVMMPTSEVDYGEGDSVTVGGMTLGRRHRMDQTRWPPRENYSVEECLTPACTQAEAEKDGRPHWRMHIHGTDHSDGCSGYNRRAYD